MRFLWQYALLYWLAAAVSCAEDKVTIEPREKRAALFGESEVELPFEVRSEEPLAGQLVWTLSANQRTLHRGELPFAAGPGKAAGVKVPLKIPAVKDGVVFPVELAL